MVDQTPAPEKPSDAGPSEPAASSAPSEPAAPAERYGVIAVSRNRKDDGRNLLLYTREEPVEE
ncbi:MAG TPA: hypothetical protein VGN08_02490 [Solirubrobacteraceae bacterium]|jgi:hypothetical protein